MAEAYAELEPAMIKRRETELAGREGNGCYVSFLNSEILSAPEEVVCLSSTSFLYLMFYVDFFIGDFKKEGINDIFITS